MQQIAYRLGASEPPLTLAQRNLPSTIQVPAYASTVMPLRLYFHGVSPLAHTHTTRTVSYTPSGSCSFPRFLSRALSLSIPLLAFCPAFPTILAQCKLLGEALGVGLGCWAGMAPLLIAPERYAKKEAAAEAGAAAVGGGGGDAAEEGE